MKYFSMFSGIGGFELGIKYATDNKFECIGYSEVDRYAESIYKRQFPNHIGYGDATEIRTDELPDFDLLVGGFPCFTANTLIQTDRGVLPIIDVNKGDKVLTHKNRYMPVVNKMVKQYNDIGYKIYLPFFGKDNFIECTDNHPFYIYNDGEPIWKEAKDLKEDDYCFVPINNEHYNDINFSFTKWINQHSSKTQDVVLDDEDWWWCVGYYIGDGWYQKRRKRDGKWQKTTRITLATNPKECEYVASRFSKFFKCNIQKDKRKIAFSNSCFYHFVKELGDKASEKRLPNDFDKYPIHILSALIDGYMYADGYKNNKILGCSTISKQLAFQVFIALIKIYDTMPIFAYIKTPDKTIIEGREVNQSDYYQVKVNTEKTRELMVIKDNGIWIKIKKIEKYEINELVYNLEVENDNSYTANGIGVHNCQAFSIAGHRRGFDDTRGTLFFEIARILRDKRPKYFLLENVKGLLSHDKGKTFQKILEVLSDLGYYVKWEIFNSKNYGVPQNRERLFIEGYSRDRCGVEVLLKPRESKETITRMNSYYNKTRSVNVVDTDGISCTLTAGGQHSGGNTLIKLNKKPQAQTIYDPDGLSCCLSANGGGDGGKTGLYKVDDKESKIKVINKGVPNPGSNNVYDADGGLSPTLCARDYKDPVKVLDKDSSKDDKLCMAVLTPDRLKKRQNGRRMKEDGEPSFTLTATDQHGVSDGFKVRKLTPRECERLQGFPDDWTLYGHDGKTISNTQRYKCCGNAVTTHVVAAVISRMFDLD